MCSDFLENICNNLNLLEKILIADIDNMQQNIRFYGIFQSRCKCFDQSRRKITNKSYRIGKQHFFLRNIFPIFGVFRFKRHFPHTRSQRGKEFIFGKYSFFGENIQQTRFSSIGISDDSGDEKSAIFSGISMGLSSLFVVFELSFDVFFTFFQMSEHDRSIGFSFPPRSFYSSRSLASEFFGHGKYSGSHVFDGSEFYL